MNIEYECVKRCAKTRDLYKKNGYLILYVTVSTVSA